MRFPTSNALLTAILLAGSSAVAAEAAPAGRPSQGLREKAFDVQVSPCGRHRLRVGSGSVFVDGRRVHRPGERVHLVSLPVWRSDGQAVAWVENTNIGARLTVLVDVSRPDAPMFWALPFTTSDDQLAWAGPHRVVVGSNILSPRAVASWTEDQR